MDRLLRLNLLGPFQAFDRDRPLTAFATDKVRALLVFLAMEPDIPHRRESLATLLYPDWSDREAADNFRKTLHRLRAALDHGGVPLSADLLDITRHTVQLNGAALALDAARFRTALAERAGKAKLSDDDLETLAEAAAFYRGEFAAGLSIPEAQPFEEWLLLQRLGLHQQALFLCDLLAAGFERHGDFARGQQFARRALALEPWREEAHLHLIRLLAASGQRSEALAQFEHCQQLLADEMGMEPGDELLALVASIREGRFQAQPREVAAAPRAHLHHFPAQFTSFIGREPDLDAVMARLLDPACRMVTLVGAGGMGKTRLSVQVAQRLAQSERADFADGFYFVDAAPLTRADDLPSALALALGLALQGESPALSQVRDFLHGKALLLVLDNLEQITGCGEAVAELLGACPRLKVLATSREPLQIRAEWRYDLGGLERAGGLAGSAAQLFIHRARQFLPAFDPVSEEEQAVRRICEILSGNALAIELAATWLRFYSCAEIASELERGLDFLESDLRDLPRRHRSIRVLFEHSWRLLAPSEQKALRQLSVLRGEWTLAQGSAVADGTPRELARLSDKSLIRRTGAGRYAIDELIRQFACQHLAGEELKKVRGRCASFFLGGLARQQASLRGMAPQAAVAAVRADWLNTREAWRTAVELRQWALLESAVDACYWFVELTGLVTDALADFELLLDGGVPDPSPLAAAARAALAWWHYRRARYEEADRLVDALLALPERDEFARWRAQAWYVRGSVQFVRGDTPGASESAGRALNAFRASGDMLGEANVLALRANVAAKDGAFAESLDFLKAALAHFERLRHPLGLMKTLSRMGVIHRRRAEYQEALAHHLRCLELVERLHSPAELARHHNNIGVVYRSLHDYDKAIHHFTLAIEADERIGHRRGLAMEKGNLGLIYQETYRYDDALHHFAEAVDIARDIGLRGVEANYMGCRGELYSDLGQFERARQELESTVALARSMGNHPTACIYAGSLAWARFRLGEHAQGIFQIGEAAAEQARFNLREMLAQSLYLKAVMHAELGEEAEALQCAHDAVALREEIGLRDLAALRAHLLDARLRARLSNRETALAELRALAADQQGEEERAAAFYALWAATRGEQERRTARPLILSALERTGRYEYRAMLDAIDAPSLPPFTIRFTN